MSGDILQMASAGPDDNSPMQFISAELLAHYRALDAELHALRLIIGWLSMHGAANIDAGPEAHSAPAGPGLD